MNSKEDIIQNLKDAGCEEDTITAFMKDVQEDKLNEGLKLLAVYRRSLLDHIHKEQKQIDCLDYLVYTMQKKSRA
jgi:hypothetical protein